MAGQIVDASLVPAPKQRHAEAESEPVNTTGSRERANAIKDGKTAKEFWPDEPNKAAQKDTNARWTLKIGGKVRCRPDGTPLPMILVPVFGYKSHISIDRRYGYIRESAASAADGRQLRRLVSRENTGSEVWADSAYRSQRNETWLAKRLLVSRIHRRKPAGKSMPRHMARANARKSAIRAAVEHVFAHQKTRFGVRQCLSDHWRSLGSLIRTIGLARAEAKLTLANIAYNFERPIFHERRHAMA
ncbi:MAG: transposase [Pseudomonadota bacterium]